VLLMWPGPSVTGTFGSRLTLLVYSCSSFKIEECFYSAMSKATNNYRTMAKAALQAHALGSAKLTHLGEGENITYQVKLSEAAALANTPFSTYDSSKMLLRLHRPQGHLRAKLWNTMEVVQSELRWLEALRQDTALIVPIPVPAANGASAIATQSIDGSNSCVCTLMRWVPGRYAGVTPSRRSAFLAGAVLGQLHQHSRTWLGSHLNETSLQTVAGHETFSWQNTTVTLSRLALPNGLIRPLYDPAMLIDWPRLCLHRAQSKGLPSNLGYLMTAALDRADAVLASLPVDASNFGLIHADFVPTNYLIFRGQCRAIDFSSCGFGWYMADIGIALASLSLDTHSAFLRGYQSVLSGPTDDSTSPLESFYALGKIALALESFPNQCIYADHQSLQEYLSKYVTADTGALKNGR
jgi:Ser/Thr protein kinase RdoA (MazF antagonist)